MLLGVTPTLSTQTELGVHPNPLTPHPLAWPAPH